MGVRGSALSVGKGKIPGAQSAILPRMPPQTNPNQPSRTTRRRTDIMLMGEIKKKKTQALSIVVCSLPTFFHFFFSAHTHAHTQDQLPQSASHNPSPPYPRIHPHFFDFIPWKPTDKNRQIPDLAAGAVGYSLFYSRR